MPDNPNRGAVLITGASTGIGRACTEHLDSLGFTVFAGVRKQTDADSLRGIGSGRTQALMLDVTDSEAIVSALRSVDEAAPAGLAGLVNNAGIAVAGPLEFVTLDDWRRQLEVNFIGQVAVIQAALPALRRARGRIVNMTSIGGRLASPFLGPYSASKYALEAITDSLRLELRPFGIAVAAVEPGAVATPIWGKGRAEAEQATANMPAQAMQLYRNGIEALPKLIAQAERSGVAPLEVARAVGHALTASRPKTRYVVGRDAKARLLLTRLLPTRVMDKIVVRGMGI
ncbi:MAG TPA: SDR family oxidoreductase [Solirubrobacteraceae bacterium]|nr:SDR family oxidoreductase [Solirubrobacteraceae bacterium]